MPRTRRLAPLLLAAPLAALTPAAGPLLAQPLCTGYGPQTPRDISRAAGSNPRHFTLAPPPGQMNLCNIHTHTFAEHKGPGFSIHAVEGGKSGYRCNDTGSLTAAELEDPAHGHGAYHNVAPGDTIEVHWVYTSCAATPGEGLGACLTEACANPELRVETQVFLLVNDPGALDFNDYMLAAETRDGLYQPRALPGGTGAPVVFAGSTTGPSYSEAKCSPMQVTWSVRPQCARLDISSLHAWAAAGNVFAEAHSHGVRALVTAPELLSQIAD